MGGPDEFYKGLPWMEGFAAACSAGHTPARAPGSGLPVDLPREKAVARVLIVDDDDAIRGVLAKPFELEQVLATVDKALSGTPLE